MKIHRDAIAKATDEQLLALRDNVLAHWDRVDDEDITIVLEPNISRPPTLMISMAGFVIGIEPDGYTHS